jgi:hypothetical protein
VDNLLKVNPVSALEVSNVQRDASALLDAIGSACN